MAIRVENAQVRRWPCMARVAPDAEREPRCLLLRFAIYTLIVLTLAAGAIVWFAEHAASARAERAAAFHARFVADTILRDRLRLADLRAPVGGARAAELDRLFRREVLVEGALRVMLYGRDGKLVYSSDRSVLTRPSGDARVREALAGRTVHDVGRLGPPVGTGPSPKVLEAYVPLRFGPAARPAGAFELSQDYRPVARDIRAAVLPVAGALAVALALLWVSLYPILRRVTAVLRLRNRRLSEQAEELTRTLAERVEAEEARRQSDARYRELFEGASDMVATFDIEGRYTSVNRAGEEVLGYGRSALIGRHSAEIVAPEHAETLRRESARLLAGEIDVSALELEVVAKDGRRVVLEAHTQLVTKDGRPVGFQGIGRDITERRALEEQFRQAQKMEAVGRLAGGIAHDFNNLLLVIKGYTSLLVGAFGDHPRRTDLDEIAAAADRATELTRQLLAFGRKQVLQPRPLDLNEVVAETEGMLRRLIGEDVVIETVLAPDLGAVRADPGQIVQVLLNLAVNARDAMPAGGRLTIATRDTELDETAARRTGLQSGPCVALAVSDTGCGMDAETQSRVFEPFYTTKEPGKGTGLGLSTVYGIVTQSGGRVTVASKPGEGTTFTLFFPRLAAAVAEVEPVEPETMAGPGSETVLLVEDQEQVRGLLREVLEEQGYRVLEAGNGQEALEVARRFEGPIELLVTDVVMPALGGHELVERLAETRPGTRVLYLSGHDERALELSSRNGVGFLQKPFAPDTLRRAVRDALDRPAADLLPAGR